MAKKIFAMPERFTSDFYWVSWYVVEILADALDYPLMYENKEHRIIYDEVVIVTPKLSLQNRYVTDIYLHYEGRIKKLFPLFTTENIVPSTHFQVENEELLSCCNHFYL